MMLQLLETAQQVLLKGKIDGPQMDSLRRQLYSDGGIDRPKTNVIVGLHHFMPQTPALQRLFYKAIKDHLLACKQLGAQETQWLRQTLSVEDEFRDEECTLVRELRGESSNCGPEFEILFKECMTRATDSRCEH